MINFSIKTLGCKVNQYESEKMESGLKEAGFTMSRSWLNLNIIIINTCAVTHIAERKSRQFIRKAAKLNPTATIFITGCATKTDSTRLQEILGVNVIYFDKEMVVNHIRDLFKPSLKATLPVQYHIPIEEDTTEQPDHCRSYLMIQDGCENFCSYCIIPHIRGRNKPKAFHEIKKEILALNNKGCKEIVLTGINLGMYKDEDYSLTNVCSHIFYSCPETRIRLSSIEPNLIPDHLVDLMANEKRFCKHLHIPLQSGSDTILRKMNRKYSTSEYLNLITRIRARIPDISITTDLIIGFPTESEKEFYETLTFIKRCQFSKIHIFPYSRRIGTPAAELQQSITQTELQKRLNLVSFTEKEMRLHHLSQFVNTCQEILLEQEKDGFFWGYTSNYLRVCLPNNSYSSNTFVNVLINRLEEGFLHSLPL
ncbi:MAG: tRNA (N(6)-L-threonylcarbamoyladenosine(37)-C(2))-methylthiotransferase MtaB [Candidatus Margulisiibacteriota bacterium]|nr:MAG: tRNA (N(6)-L-threonylcarbamoyladenosine(37)-C(2))-methylthiotransferase MtaB [Candidatus Margulisbacteria bacterium GWD2_39_127]OGI05221.1 MAG: tRNA (N(6)-L-threonylcarbamoyladenosine(37)-C(2))-methylthiotransferase MtaB [Candidatus Margulisbacteria bacterium GWF2_38_17]OGI06270.1 MAG: tRNA (N(6)-L-threonylcarbamoyladenosine(37)-C(2))-methylthiotransferase MtaB [Candidatus Margulisbacteria bacterium GWE2_39_32]PZM78928.1 MAG: tRNA (N(6)-L-threonylcarbamoyladenosine(37)-C(2))-methylthiotr